MRDFQAEPIVFQWAGGEVSLGYLGRFRWRLRYADTLVEAADARAAAALTLDQIFHGTTPGQEVAERAPIQIRELNQTSTLNADARMFNGWKYSGIMTDFTVGPHNALLAFVTELLASSAETSWAVGVQPQLPPPLGREFRFAAFVAAGDRQALCRRLESVLTQRLRNSPNPPQIFLSAMQELKSLGHDLWSWDTDRLWGNDYGTRRHGAGLVVSRDGETVEVRFDPPAPRPLLGRLFGRG